MSDLMNAVKFKNASSEILEDSVVRDRLEQYLPEPSSTGSGIFQDVLNTASDVSGVATNILTGGVLGSTNFESLLNAQMQVQMEMQSVSMESNIERSKHESRMTPIRNLKLN